LDKKKFQTKKTPRDNTEIISPGSLFP